MKRYRRNAIKRTDWKGGPLAIEPIDRYYPYRYCRNGKPAARTSATPGARWKCDAMCGAGMPRDGVVLYTCPKAHVHHVCTPCALMFSDLGIVTATIEPGRLRRGMEIGPTIKLSRCPHTITEGDRVMAALRKGAEKDE